MNRRPKASWPDLEPLFQQISAQLFWIVFGISGIILLAVTFYVLASS
jgi:hypothetical protein